MRTTFACRTILSLLNGTLEYIITIDYISLEHHQLGSLMQILYKSFIMAAEKNDDCSTYELLAWIQSAGKDCLMDAHRSAACKSWRNEAGH